MTSDGGNPRDQLEVLMRAYDRPENRKWGARIAALLGLLVAAGILFSTLVYTVEPDGKAVVKRFGRVIDVAEPGLHFKLPFGIDTATFVPTERILKEEFGFRTVEAGRRSQYRSDGDLLAESLMLTGDLNVIDVQWVVQYQIADPDRYLHEVRRQEETIRDVSEAVMRRIVGNRLASDVLTVGRVSIADATKLAIQEILEDYEMGVRLVGVELQDVTPPDKVKPAFNEVNEARQERERLINEAEKRRNTVIPKARGEAKEVVAEAKAYQTQRVNAAKGEAARFTSILSEYRQAPEVTRQRLFLETLDQFLPDARLVVSEEGSAQSALPLLRLNVAASQGGAK
jgi:membrane protease subunit HflK